MNIDGTPDSDDRKRWTPGPWCDIPAIQHLTINGYPCVVRQTAFGILCGYIGIPAAAIMDRNRSVEDLSVHGGITYYASGNSPIGVDGDGLIWLGFDCAHPEDLLPEHPDLPLASDREWRDQDFVRAELEKLTKQLETI